MPISLFASTMSMLDNTVPKNGHSRYIACNSAMPPSGCPDRNPSTAVPNPYQPGSINRHCAQLNTHGIVRKPSRIADQSAIRPIGMAGELFHRVEIDWARRRFGGLQQGRLQRGGKQDFEIAPADRR